jgi:hypothetical protein
VVHITTGTDWFLFYVNLLVPVFLPLRAGADEDGTIQEKCLEFVTTQEVILRRRSHGFNRQQLNIETKIRS